MKTIFDVSPMMTSSIDILSAILSTAPDAIIRIDQDGKILDFLGRAEVMFGYAPDEILGEPISRLMPDAAAREHDGYIRAYLETGERKLPDFGRRLQALHKNGNIFPVEIALSEVSQHGQKSFVGIVRDVSKRVLVERDLAKISEQLSVATTANALGESAAAMAHELNQPLTAIANYADALDIKLQRFESSDAKQLQALAHKAGEQARLCGEIVKRIRRTLVRHEYNVEKGNFHEAVKQSVDAVMNGIDAHDVEILVMHNGQQASVEFDRLQLHQVVSHLIANALIALKDADIRQIIVETEINDHQAELRISDSGSGVPDSRKKEIFEAFVGDSLSGLGLGLAVAKRIANTHSGKIWVEDGKDGGAVFRFVFPIQPTL